ncbi:hypothetical protein GXB78_02815 [Pseudomonas moraviensis subsp. stanleyae]|uniref:hypothetical protein n=1 Tax=Pseudomonas moraviensis TaxID=321662 RepID=UPI002E359908|nr:hypothetical protein [Pseudomonas moraviensis]MED7666145.1 hypothetical protein [Pseudomonas moraviensis subsp. stanleyae]
MNEIGRRLPVSLPWLSMERGEYAVLARTQLTEVKVVSGKASIQALKFPFKSYGNRRVLIRCVDISDDFFRLVVGRWVYSISRDIEVIERTDRSGPGQRMEYANPAD